MAKRNQKKDRSRRMKRNDEKGIGEGNSKYALKCKGSTIVRFKYTCAYREILAEGKYRIPAKEVE